MSNTNQTILITSFGFKHGLPPEAHIVMDVRFLQNPFWVDALKELTGQDEKVGAYIEEDENFAAFMHNFQTMLEPLLPGYMQDREDNFTIAVGCTGGHHRSVHVVETLGKWMESLGFTADIQHRDITR